MFVPPFTAEEAADATTTLLGLAQITADRLDPDAMVPAEAMAQLKVVTKTRKVLAAVEMSLSARVADSEQWKGEGDDTAADRIAKETGKSKKQAKDDLTTARRAKKDEKLRKALNEGRVSPEQAKAIGAAGQADPEATEDLLDLADQGAPLGELNEEAERIRREAEGEAHKAKARARAHAGRFARSWTKDEMFFLLLGVPVDVGAELLAHLDVERDHVFAQDRRDGTKGTFENRSADALVNLICGRSAADEAAPPARHDPMPAPEPARAPTPDGEPDDDPDQQDLFSGPHRSAGDDAEPDEPAAPITPTPGPSDPRPTGGGSPPTSGAPPPARRRSGPPRKSEASGRMVARLDIAHLWGAPGDTTCEIAGVGTVSLDALRAALPEPLGPARHHPRQGRAQRHQHRTGRRPLATGRPRLDPPRPLLEHRLQPHRPDPERPPRALGRRTGHRAAQPRPHVHP